MHVNLRVTQLPKGSFFYGHTIQVPLQCSFIPWTLWLGSLQPLLDCEVLVWFSPSYRVLDHDIWEPHVVSYLNHKESSCISARAIVKKTDQYGVHLYFQASEIKLTSSQSIDWSTCKYFSEYFVNCFISDDQQLSIIRPWGLM